MWISAELSTSSEVVRSVRAPRPSISLRRMDQLFPTPVDDVDTTAVYAGDDRTATGDRPWVMANMISSVDGAVAIDGVSGGLGGPGDKAAFRAIRAVADVIVAASGTVIAENYRRPQTPPDIQEMRVARGQSPLPRIAIVSGSLNIAPDHRVFDPEAPPLVITHAQSPADRRRMLGDVADIIVAGDGSVDFADALQQLKALGADTVLVEGGPTLNAAFVGEDLIDEFCLSFSPLLVGGSGPRVVGSTHSHDPRPLHLDRTLHEDGFLFHRYLRQR